MPRLLLNTALSRSLLALFIAGMLSTGCSDQPASPSANDDIHTATYEVRGQITSLPDADNPATSLNIKHEAIPDFVDAQGKTVGMDAMTMPFPPAEGLELAPFAVGDKVSVTFEVTWGGGQNGWEATELKPLPAETELDFTTSASPDADHSGHDHGDHHGHQH